MELIIEALKKHGLKHGYYVRESDNSLHLKVPSRIDYMVSQFAYYDSLKGALKLGDPTRGYLNTLSPLILSDPKLFKKLESHIKKFKAILKIDVKRELQECQRKTKSYSELLKAL